MRFTKTFIAAAIGAATLCACTEDLPEMETSGNVLQVSTNVNATTKAIIEGQLGANQKIGISLLATDGSNYNGKTEGYKNVPYNSELLTTGGVNWTAEKPIILSPAIGTAYAYYPYSAAVSDIKAIPVETASQTDYMYADPVEGLNSSFAKANFSLNHALCAVQINIKNDSYTQGPGNISRIAVSSAELATAASLNSMTGELSAFSGKGGEIVDTNAFTIGKEAHATTVMAVPTGGQGELSIKITLDGKNHRVRIPVKEPFVKGKRYILDILAKDKTAPLEIVSVNVKPWVEESLGEYPMEVSSDEYVIEVMVQNFYPEESFDGFPFTSNAYDFTGTIDWGDGTVTQHTAEYNPSHTYAKAGTYTVTHKGSMTSIDYSCFRVARTVAYSEGPKFIKDIIYIGENLGVSSMNFAFYGCVNLKELRSEIFNSLIKVRSFRGTFEGCYALTTIPQGLFDNCTQVESFYGTFSRCSSLTEIPAGLFDKCTYVRDFQGTFSGCSSLTTIPQGLFDNCTQVTSFYGTFENCYALTGESPYTLINGHKVHLYERKDYPGHFSTPKSCSGCFRRCTDLTDYNEIPADWK